jgi:hypothetical protein
MKRGENGIISVSMGSLGQLVAALLFRLQLTPLVLIVRQNDDNCYDSLVVIPGREQRERTRNPETEPSVWIPGPREARVPE